MAAGDNQRGQDQMLVIEALIDKVTSPSILYNYSNVLETVRNLFQTSLDDDDIASMVKLTMEDATGWNVQKEPVHFLHHTSLVTVQCGLWNRICLRLRLRLN